MELKHATREAREEERNLLIVPYGIETSQCRLHGQCEDLLIVPYGIETVVLVHQVAHSFTFNRTLWN